MSDADLLALASRCEQAAGADRELDEAIRDAMPEDWQPPLRLHFASAPEFTASLDAAVSLAPEGWDFYVGYKRPPWAPEAAVWKRFSTGTEKKAYARTPALALTAACLKASAAEMGQP